MQIKYLINEQPITIGQTITLTELGECVVNLLYHDSISVRDKDGFTYHVYHRQLSSNGVTIERLPEIGYFHRVTGERLREGDVLNGVTVEGIYDDVLRFKRLPDEDYKRFVELDPSVENLGYGVEIRVHPTKEQLESGLPRVTREDGVMCVVIDDELVPATEAVWLSGAYRRIRDCYLQAGWETRYILDTTGMVRLSDGRFAMENEIAEINYGPRSGERVYFSEARPTYDGFIVPADEVIVHLNDYGGETLRCCVQPGWVQFGRFYTDASSIVECPRTRIPNHLSRMVRLDTNELVSREWADLNTCTCGECGSRYEPENESSSGNECRTCRRGARTRIRNYSNRSAGYFPPEQNVPIKFGIELEVGCDRGYSRSECAEVVADAIDESGVPVDTYAIFKEDGSLSSCDGFEIVTRPDSPAVHKRIWSSVLSEPEMTTRMTSFNNGKCGMHIHVSREPLTSLWIGRMLVLVNSTANRPLIHKIAGRGGNDYTRYYQKKLSDGSGYGVERYESLNTTGDHTIEFRMFRGTLFKDSFLKNIEFVEAVLEFTRPAARSVRDMDTPSAFLDFISKSRKSYPHLFGFLVNRQVLTK